MMLQCCQEWTQSSQLYGPHVHGSVWQVEPTRQPEEFTGQERQLHTQAIDAPVAPGSDEAEEDDKVPAIPESPRAPKPMRGFVSRSPNSKLLSTSSQQASLPATPQPRGHQDRGRDTAPRSSTIASFSPSTVLGILAVEIV
jgi:hypothetical protein